MSEESDDIWAMLGPIEESLSTKIESGSISFVGILDDVKLFEEVKEEKDSFVIYFKNPEVWKKFYNHFFLTDLDQEEVKKNYTQYIFKFPFVCSQILLCNSRKLMEVFFSDQSYSHPFFRFFMDVKDKKQLNSTNTSIFISYMQVYTFFLKKYYCQSCDHLQKMIQDEGSDSEKFLESYFFRHFELFEWDTFFMNFFLLDIKVNYDGKNFGWSMVKKDGEEEGISDFLGVKPKNEGIDPEIIKKSSIEKQKLEEYLVKSDWVGKLLSFIDRKIESLGEIEDEAEKNGSFLCVKEMIENTFLIFQHILQNEKVVSILYENLFNSAQHLFNHVTKYENFLSPAEESKEEEIDLIFTLRRRLFSKGMNILKLLVEHSSKDQNNEEEDGETEEDTMKTDEFLWSKTNDVFLPFLEDPRAGGRRYTELRLSIVDLIYSLVQSLPITKICGGDLKIFKCLVGLFERFPRNNILHLRVFQILVFIIDRLSSSSSSSEEMVNNFFTTTDLLDGFIMKNFSDEEYKFGGFIYEICKKLGEEETEPNMIRRYLKTKKTWEEFRTGESFVDEERKSEYILGGIKVEDIITLFKESGLGGSEPLVHKQEEKDGFGDNDDDDDDEFGGFGNDDDFFSDDGFGKEEVEEEEEKVITTITTETKVEQDPEPKKKEEPKKGGGDGFADSWGSFGDGDDFFSNDF